VKLGAVIDDLRQAEVELAKQLRLLAERHAVEHDVHHLGQSLAQQGVERVERLRPFLERYGAHRAEADDAVPSGAMQALRRRTSEMLGRSEATGLALLHDLRDTYLLAQRVTIDWTILLQAAKAARDAALIAVVTSGLEEAEGTAAWLRTRIKQTAPQTLVAG
jgi:hypothetical protein